MDMNVLRYIFYVTFIFHLFILSVYFLEKFLKVITILLNLLRHV